MSAFEVVKGIISTAVALIPYLSSEDEEQYQDLLDVQRKLSDMRAKLKFKGAPSDPR